MVSPRTKGEEALKHSESPSKDDRKEEVYIKVAARLRPMLLSELNSKEAVTAIEQDGKPTNLKILTNNYFNNGERTYKFERVFRSEESQQEIFEHCSRPLCDNFVKGQNCNIIVYGPTSTGKTYTM